MTSRVYQSRLDTYATMRVYNVAGEDSVSYVSAQQYFSLLYEGEESFELEEGGQVLKVARNGITAKLDAAKRIISCESWDAFFGSYGEKALPNGILQPGEFNAQAVSRKHPSSETEDIGLPSAAAADGADCRGGSNRASSDEKHP